MDIQTVYSNADGALAMDYQVVAPGLAAEDGLQTAVIISLFTDRRAGDDDQLPDGSADRRGWWGDSYADDDGDQIGSRLWLLGRSKATPDVLQQAQQYAKEALQWLIRDDVVSKVSVSAEWQALDGGGRTLALQVELQRKDNSAVQYRFSNFWGAINGA
ncbi:phage GP46 family protein [Stenotrophomonas maltophilia]|uniref:phage GP46 family protein n=1 Tax=Stenotrophomonas maltophilia TaxID=40324 RepID=UPI0006AC71D7|nr:phage GP46 family protein [Stenotrophomonas maltophilia]KOQ71544.1 hypothetical protein ABW43_00020 [Stenotrophomonas maltophilia]MBN4937109.1 phage GP46 family protein [Stenotrophomonas maltophilia]